MIRTQVILGAICAVTAAMPAAAHVEQVPHVHADEVSWLSLTLIAVSVLGLVLLGRRRAAARS